MALLGWTELELWHFWGFKGKDCLLCDYSSYVSRRWYHTALTTKHYLIQLKFLLLSSEEHLLTWGVVHATTVFQERGRKGSWSCPSQWLWDTAASICWKILQLSFSFFETYKLTPSMPAVIITEFTLKWRSAKFSVFILQPVTLAEVLSGGLGGISGTNDELGSYLSVDSESSRGDVMKITGNYHQLLLAADQDLSFSSGCVLEL